jgi:alpha-tubulin suppressor-like RCC1 family protein
MQCHFYEMRAGQDFCFFITENGDLYVMGTNNDGMLGLGKKEADTKGLAKRVIHFCNQ